MFPVWARGMLEAWRRANSPPETLVTRKAFVGDNFHGLEQIIFSSLRCRRCPLKEGEPKIVDDQPNASSLKCGGTASSGSDAPVAISQIETNVRAFVGLVVAYCLPDVGELHLRTLRHNSPPELPG